MARTRSHGHPPEIPLIPKSSGQTSAQHCVGASRVSRHGSSGTPPGTSCPSTVPVAIQAQAAQEHRLALQTHRRQPVGDPLCLQEAVLQREKYATLATPTAPRLPKQGCLGQGAVCGPWSDDKAVHRNGAGFKLGRRVRRRPVTGAKHHPFPALNPVPLGLDVRPLDKRSWRPSSQQLGGDVRGIEGLSGRRRKRSAASGFQQGCQLCRQTQPFRWRCRTGLSEMIPAMIQQGHDLSQA